MSGRCQKGRRAKGRRILEENQWNDWKLIDLFLRTWSLQAEDRRKMAASQLLLHLPQGSASLVPGHGRYLLWAATSKLRPPTRLSCIRMWWWASHLNAKSTMGSRFSMLFALHLSM